MYNETTLDITVHRANGLDDIDKFGGNDPHVFAFINLNETEKGAKTDAAEDIKDLKWEQTLRIENLADNTTHVYVEVMDGGVTSNKPIAYAAIPLSQVGQAPDNTFAGEFKMFDKDGRRRGVVILTLRLRKSEDPSNDFEEGELQQGISEVHSKHQERFNYLQNKEKLQRFLDNPVVADHTAVFIGTRSTFGRNHNMSAAQSALNATITRGR
ncbi:hypothetical protein BGW38_007230 [Lunasporangiospora selenospora]|uniref:C2 domain-containing protein n=1 Tax=Lunasporangiospora selenospora TaxID=979761 RepID=A0A9P6KAH2_9FUNG|nr:hypothetical protein BGW38_007230 [Lunasporangiospora selenospora]